MENICYVWNGISTVRYFKTVCVRVHISKVKKWMLAHILLQKNKMKHAILDYYLQNIALYTAFSPFFFFFKHVLTKSIMQWSIFQTVVFYLSGFQLSCPKLKQFRNNSLLRNIKIFVRLKKKSWLSFVLIYQYTI